MTQALAETHYVVHSLKNILFILFKLRGKYKSQSMVRSLNHRHRKNKIPCFIFMNTRNVFCFTISHIYSCLHLLLQTDFLKISNSFIQSSLPPWKTLKILWQKQKMSHKSPTPGESTLELYKVLVSCIGQYAFEDNCCYTPENTIPVLPCFLRKSNGQRAFSSKQRKKEFTFFYSRLKNIT